MSNTGLSLGIVPSAMLIASALLGCSDPLRPSEVADIYVLERVGSDTLPAILQTGQHFRLRVVADTLRLNDDGSGLRTGLLEYEVLQGGDGTIEEVPIAQAFTFRVRMGRVEVEFACDDAASCIAPPHLVARPIDGGLRVDYAVTGRVPLIYRSVGDPD